MKKESRAVTLIYSLLTAVIAVTSSIAVPILCRPFYYAHIKPLGLESNTGMTAAQIREAYGQVVDFCVGLRADFAAGVLPFSRSGASHFADVKVLFLLVMYLLAVSAALLVIFSLFCRKCGLCAKRFFGRGPAFWSACGMAAIFFVIGAFAAADFDSAFVVFHSLFFPGKTNWMFDPRTDPVILLLPDIFFRNCAILIFALLILWCAVLVIIDIKKRD